MSGCLDNVRCDCDCGFEWQDKRNMIAAVLSAVLFFSAWWLVVDVAVTWTDQHNFPHQYYAIIVISTFSMFMVNSVSNSQVRGDSMTDGCMGTRGARIWLLFGFLLGFGSLIAAAWCMFDHYVINPTHHYPSSNTNTTSTTTSASAVTEPTDSFKFSTVPGVLLFIQNAFVFFASLIYKFGRTEELWG